MIIDHVGEDDEKEIVTLMGVNEESGSLALEDGRRLMVSPADMPTSILWLPTSTLEITKTSGENFDLVVKLQATDHGVQARWE